MKWNFFIALILGCLTLALHTLALSKSVLDIEPIIVAPPKNDISYDRQAILTAISKANAGDTIRFSKGTYYVGPFIAIEKPSLKLVGSAEGTTIKGCDIESFKNQEYAIFNCNGFELRSGNTHIEGLTFENAWHGLYLGCCFPRSIEEAEKGNSEQKLQLGGHIIESSLFKNSSNGIRVIGESAQRNIFKHNRFINTFHAIVINGSDAEITSNLIHAQNPEDIPVTGFAGGAIIIAPIPPAQTCGKNIISNNRIAGHSDGVVLHLFAPNSSCIGNEIINNTIVTEAEPASVGIPIAVINSINENPANLSNTLIKENRIDGGNGLGIEILNASDNTIIDNSINSIRNREPFPGDYVNSSNPLLSGWKEYNGSGIWISRSSSLKEIKNNTFSDIENQSIVIEKQE